MNCRNVEPVEYVEIADQIANHRNEAQRHLRESTAASEASDLVRALLHMAEAQRHIAEASALLEKLQAIDPSLGRMTDQDVDDLRELFGE